MLELRTCPFCNGEPELTHDEYGRYLVYCTEKDCGAAMVGFKDKESVIQKWNQRCGEPLSISKNDIETQTISNNPSSSMGKHSNICTIRETCARLQEDGYQISEHSLRIMVKTGRVPYLEAGNKVLLSYTPILEFLRNGDHTCPIKSFQKTESLSQKNANRLK